MKILCLPPKTLTPSQKGVLSKKGIVIIECENPEMVRIIDAENSMDSSDWFMAALKALTTNFVNPSQQDRFINELYRRLYDAENLVRNPHPAR